MRMRTVAGAPRRARAAARREALARDVPARPRGRRFQGGSPGGRPARGRGGGGDSAKIRRAPRRTEGKGFGRAPAREELPEEPSSPPAAAPSPSGSGRQGGRGAEDSNVDERVSARILKRIITFSGVPLVVGFIGFPALLLYMRVANGGTALDLPLWLGYVLSVGTFGAGFVGVSYGFFSASWDPLRDNEDFWGWEEARKNVPALLGRYGIGGKEDR